jgi:DNA-3-methyladenine glycosylase I
MTSYCDFAIGNPIHGPYHDGEYGFPLEDESLLFERLLLEINQAGLSWELMLKKRDGFRRAYSGFDVDRVADYDERDRARLLSDPGIVRNRLKVNAAIENARAIQRHARQPRRFRGLAAGPSPAEQAGLGQAVPQDLPLHRRRGHRRVPDVHRLSALAAPRGLPGIRRHRPPAAALDAGARFILALTAGASRQLLQTAFDLFQRVNRELQPRLQAQRLLEMSPGREQPGAILRVQTDQHQSFAVGPDGRVRLDPDRHFELRARLVPPPLTQVNARQVGVRADRAGAA